jgi:hypothetical protein
MEMGKDTRGTYTKELDAKTTARIRRSKQACNTWQF